MKVLKRSYSSNHLSYLFILGNAYLHDGVCGGRDAYHQATLTLQECVEKCTMNAACTAITFKEEHGGCGEHEGFVEMIPNSDSGGWPSGYTCYEL